MSRNALQVRILLSPPYKILDSDVIGSIVDFDSICRGSNPCCPARKRVIKVIDSMYEKFKNWSQNGSIWVISDLHFDDPKSKACNPDWPAPEFVVNNIKKKVGKKDCLIVLGDVGDPKYLDSLSCKKVLVKGNHDKGLTNYEKYFDELYDGILAIGKKLVLSHEPILSPVWLNIHGHQHLGYFYRIEWGCHHVNVCCDCVDFMPVNLKDICKIGALNKIPNIHRYTIDVGKIVCSKIDDGRKWLYK